MNSKRSYLDTLNTGRRRRPQTSLDRISQTLEDLEQRLDNSLSRNAGNPSGNAGIAERMQRLPQEADRRDRSRTSRASLQELTREIERARRQESEYDAVGRIASELKTLRGDLRDIMTSELRNEFETLREDLARVPSSGLQSPVSRELEAELQRLSEAIGALAEHNDDRGVKMLRLELEQVRQAVDTLAREETVRSVGKHWEDFDRRWSNFESRYASDRERSDPVFDALNARLEQIGEAVNSLPDSLSLRSLDEKVRTLAGTLEQFIEQSTGQNQSVYPLIDERLDEISRAIAASATSASAFDPEPFERIEARISSLAQQVEELMEDRSGGEVAERLNQLTQRVEDIARRVDVPEQAVGRLASQISLISEKLDSTAASPDAQVVLHGLEDRLARISDLFEQRQGDMIEQGRTLFGDLEERLNALAERLDQRQTSEGESDPSIMSAIDSRFAELARHLESRIGESTDTEALRALETRLEDISQRLQNPAEQFSGIDPEVIRNLEGQIADLSAHLSKPTQNLPAFEDLEPRLAQIERSIAENREAVVEAARRAAEEAIAGLQRSQAGLDAPALDLSNELKALDELNRKADDRNTRTFEAIHDTLLKIVDRLGALETSSATSERPASDKIAVAKAPSIEPEESPELLSGDAEDPDAPDEENGGRSKRTASQAAIAAAEAAMTNESEGDSFAGRRSMLGGLTRALSGKRRREAERADRKDPEVETTAESSGEPDQPIEEKDANEPLEPGSGGPDLNAIMKRVRDEGKRQARPAASPDAAKSDFIAAARRAAQAAAAEADMARKKHPDTDSTSSRLSVGQLLGGRKKTVLMALVGFVVVVGAMQLGKAFLVGGEDESAQVETQSPLALKQPDPQQAQDVTEAPAADAPRASAADGEQSRPVRVAPEQPAGDPGEAGTPRTAALPESAPAANTTAPDEGDIAAAAENIPEGATEEDISEGASEDAGDEVAATAPVEVEPEATVEEIALAEIPVEAGPVALREAAASGDPSALFEIGSRYADGRGVDTDMAEAAGYYEKAADLGLAPAQYRIGNFYEKGIGVERDLDNAKMWYQMAAEQGNASAMHNLGVIFAMGADGAADNASAARWFQKAAELGVRDSQFNLGILSAKGVGMEQNLADAYKWFALVAKDGDSDAAAKRDEVANALDPEQLERARATTELWKPKELSRDANIVDIPDEWTESDTTTASIDMKKAVTTIQVILNEKGYDAGPTDGLMGDKTEAAIMAFQKDNGMEPTGTVNEELVRTLLDKQ